MLAVLIVDDELIVRCGIRSMINGEKLGLTVVGEAANGKEAMELFCRLNPEIVITDIKMPIMDGIELLNAIRATNTATRIIILSCYDDFEYVREALRFGASEYLIKSDIKPDNLEALLLKIKKAIEKERAEQASMAKIHSTIKQTETIIMEKYLWELSLGIIAEQNSQQYDLHLLGLDAFREHLVLLCVGINYFEKISEAYAETRRKELINSLDRRIHDSLKKYSTMQFLTYLGYSGQINVLVKLSSMSELEHHGSLLQQAATEIIKTAHDELQLSVNIGISNLFNNLSGLKQAYNQAQEAYKCKMFVGCGQAICYSARLDLESENYEPIRVNLKELQNQVYLLDQVQLRYFLEELFTKLEQNWDYEEVNLVGLELVLALNNIYADINKDNEAVLQKKKDYYEQIKHLETVNDLRSWFQEAFAQLIVELDRIYHDDHNIIDKALDYIQRNYQKPLSLDMLSEYVHLSKNYFANLFRQEAGESFVEYLTNYRMERARHLLENTNLKVYDIGSAVGIEDAHYFSKVFKKVTGLTPTDYRERLRNN